MNAQKALGLVITNVFVLGATFAAQPASDLVKLRTDQLARLRTFAAQKEQLAEALAQKANEKLPPEYSELFSAAKKGDGQTVTNLYETFLKRQKQSQNRDLPRISYWSTLLELELAFEDFNSADADYLQLAIDGFMKSIPPGCIYFGGTDSGRGLPTAFSKDHAKGDPFFTITQNALADGTYLEYVRAIYGDKLYIPTAADSQEAFKAYLDDAQARLKAGTLKAGEDVRIVEGRISVSGQTAVMDINGRLARIIFDKSPNREFYVEESFPLDWMFPYLVPAGHIMKLGRKPVQTISEAAVKKDADYWANRIETLLGARIAVDGSVSDLTRQIESIYIKQSSKVDPRFIKDHWAQRGFSKWRSGIANLYMWHAREDKDPAERDRMGRVAETAARQAYLICPYSPEAVYRYVDFLVKNSRKGDAKQILETSLKITPDNKNFLDLKSALEAAK